MTLLRTPDERFASLPGFPYAPHYVELGGRRMHYVDEGPRAGEVVLCLHGEPTWSYLYRKMIPILAERHRVVAPDFFGFGRSDKYAAREDYTFQMHFDSLVEFLERLDLRGVTLVCQDWGGLIGLPVAMHHPNRFARLVIMNTGVPTGEEPATPAFLQWQEFARRTPDLPIAFLMQRTFQTGDDTDPAVLAAYEAPYPDASYKAGAAQFPLLVPTSTDNPATPTMKETRRRLAEWRKPCLVMFGDSDPITGPGYKWFRKLVPTAADEPEALIEKAGHFLQEDQGEELARQIDLFIARRPVPA
ncbi:MAG: haloalkane dehalogenase [Pirellulales bacterium]|nr:haloalkane dehalogenase [Pirellulales bacterium]